MSLAVGIVGLPNVGKSTLFKALTKKQVDASNYPFCTIDPNVGVVAVPDERLDILAKISHSEKITPTIIEFVDIAGLVKDAHKGEGLGNQFLANIREVDAIVQVVRKFSDSNVTHVAGKIDPESDRETINLELIFADLQTIDKRLVGIERDLKAGKKEARELNELLLKLKTGLENGKIAREIIIDEKDFNMSKQLNLLTIKPMIYVLNVDEDKIFQELDFVVISAKIEAELAELNQEEAASYLKQLELESTGLDKLIRKSYEILDLITYFTSGEKETRAWTIKNGTKAPEAAGKIHTDFEKGFIKAEVIYWQDLVKLGSEMAAKEKGLLRIEGKEYVVKDGDVMHFRFN